MAGFKRTKAKKVGHDELKEIALELYLAGHKTQRQICELIGITEPTFTRWKNENGWDDLKGAILGNRHKIIAAIYRQVLKDVTDLDENGQSKPLNFDALAKASRAIQAFSPRQKINLEQYTTAFREFTTWLLEQGNVELSVQLTSLHDQFVNHLIQEQL